MLPIDKLTSPGEHPFSFEGRAGCLEGILTVPAEVLGHHVALLGHPHSLQGGSMNNKVVTTLARAFRDLGIPSLRFNFRGVGKSAGTYDEGRGESDDMLVLRALWAKQLPDYRFLFAGFSFGSYVVWRAAVQCEHEILITVAPPVHHFDYSEWQQPPAKWDILQGDDDEVVPLQRVLEFAAGFRPALNVIRFAETGHFFHGKLLPLRDEVIRLVRQQVLLK